MNERFTYQRLTASALLTSSPSGILGGIFCSSGTGTIKIYDGVDNTGVVIIDTFSPINGQSYPFPAIYTKGIYIEITGTPIITAFFV